MAEEDYDELVEQAATQAADDRAFRQALAELGVGPDDFVTPPMPIWSESFDWDTILKAAHEGRLRMFLHSERDPSDLREVMLGKPIKGQHASFVVRDEWQIPAGYLDENGERKRCWCGGAVGQRWPGDEDGLGCLEEIEHIWNAPAGEAPC